jgi:hypothetical protein
MITVARYGFGTRKTEMDQARLGTYRLTLRILRSMRRKDRPIVQRWALGRLSRRTGIMLVQASPKELLVKICVTPTSGAWTAGPDGYTPDDGTVRSRSPAVQPVHWHR